MNARDFLSLARRLVTDPAEAAWRSAISRAYYAAFHVARELLEDLRFQVPRTEQAHKYLAHRLSNCGVVQVQRAGSDLDALRDLRNQADYDLRRPMAQKIVSARLQLAERIIQIFDAARLEPARSQITDTIKIYERDVLREVTWHP